LTALLAEVALFFEKGIDLFKATRNSVHLFLLRITFFKPRCFLEIRTEPFRSHRGRYAHRFSTSRYGQGFGPKRIQALMGHSSITQTFDRYGYLFEAGEADTTAMAAITVKLVEQ